VTARDLLRIGCGGGFWGDSEEGPGQLVRSGGIDVLVMDYLAEITMALLARLKARDPRAGYVPDVIPLLGRLAPELRERGIRVVVNAGGINPEGCRDALEAEFARVGVPLGDRGGRGRRPHARPARSPPSRDARYGDRHAHPRARAQRQRLSRGGPDRGRSSGRGPTS
jgi:hypothetical protein